ncbi:23S rRNA (guanine745-N1)-methyltransferase [Nocardiopsis metallicus]|uniref:23S rRNA (Guanine745-N1)-methyltransferase n=2 Tax=Nocardiopsis metallicus TaxID=179819 RepID=A0A840W465_9ACTN|nr:methyltransferase domain-containing protein [Nocardiopsis metallicus]MBB5490093.1 23S rRNA (guanine745-N1)-methyltransferase [Nocardiopsis metallicus]
MTNTRTGTHSGPELRMPASVAAALTCPVCGNPLIQGPRGLSCASGHSFNIAREGYAGLLTGATPPGAGDSKDMVAARLRFQAEGHYDPIGLALAEQLAAGGAAGFANGGVIVDVGGGTGHYLNQVLDRIPEAVGLTTDVSKFAARKAARAHPRSGAVTADSWRRLPLADDTADALLNVFAPRNAAEFHRVLKAGGVLLVVTPAADHLAEPREALGLLDVDPRKDERLAEGLKDHFALESGRDLRFTMELAHEDVLTVVGMGPSARHVTPGELRNRIGELPDPVAVTASVRLQTYRAR